VAQAKVSALGKGSKLLGFFAVSQDRLLPENWLLSPDQGLLPVQAQRNQKLELSFQLKQLAFTSHGDRLNFSFD